MDNQPIQPSMPTQPPQQPIVSQPLQPRSRSRLKKPLLLITLLLLLFAASIYATYAWQHKKTTNLQLQVSSLQAQVNKLAQTNNSQTTKETTSTPAGTVDPNAGYLVMSEWGLRFKVPSSLTDVKYVIHNDQADFYARPAGSSVQYRSDYTAFNGSFPRYAVGVLYRSTSSTNTTARPDMPVQGKKVGNYYYYTAWSFSSLASGAACVGLYGDTDSSCQAEKVVFPLMNGSDSAALLMTIQLAQ